MHDYITPGRKGQHNSRQLSPSARFSKYHIAKPSKLNRPLRVHLTSHLASPLHFRHLQSDLIRGLQMNQESFDALIALSPNARAELAWWFKHNLNANGSLIHLPPPDMIVTTNASKIGWCAVHQSLQTNGLNKNLSNASII